MKVWDRAGIKLATPGSAVGLLATAVQGPVLKRNKHRIKCKQEFDLAQTLTSGAGCQGQISKLCI